MPLSPLEAASRIHEQVTVEMLVKAATSRSRPGRTRRCVAPGDRRCGGPGVRVERLAEGMEDPAGDEPEAEEENPP
jgi:hypothetical protein